MCLVIISLAKDSLVFERRNQGWDGKNRVCQVSVQLHGDLEYALAAAGLQGEKQFSLHVICRKNHLLLSIIS